MATERTFSIIKPDATRRNLTGKINAMFEDSDPDALAAARQQWIGLKDRNDLIRSYWQQDARGGWKKA